MHGSQRPDPTIVAGPDFRVGATLVRPARRELVGPAGTVAIEPRVMQVLLALAAAGGGVVTRDALVRGCWNGQFVGDDALNRAIAQVRKAARDVDPGGTAPDALGIATIAKSGYRLTGTVVPGAPAVSSPVVAAVPVVAAGGASRRTLIAGSVAAVAVAAAGGVAVWRAQPTAMQVRAVVLADRGAQLLRDEMPDSDAQGVGFLREAARLDPGSAAIWGRLALAERNVAEFAEPGRTAAAVAACETAARRALTLDPRQGDALAALARLQPVFGDWLGAERRLRSVLAVAPDNIAATGALAMMLISAGRIADGLVVNGRAATLEPLSPVFQYRRVYQLWAVGRTGEADRVADRAVALWPLHPGVWFARLWTLAFTGRSAVAAAMLGDAAARPPMPPPIVAAMRTTMAALAAPAAATTAAAVTATLAMAARGPAAAVFATLMLAGLGATDQAFAVTEGYLLRRGDQVMTLRHTAAELAVNDQRYRKTMMLFMPVTAPLRADGRFAGLCDAIGLTAYWRASRTRPDFLGDRPLPA